MNDRDPGIDLSALDPENDPDRLERVVARVLHDLGPGLVEESPSAVDRVAHVYARWFRPLCAVASVIALAAAAVLARGGTPDPDQATRTAGGAPLPDIWSDWTATGTPPAARDLWFSLVETDR